MKLKHVVAIAQTLWLAILPIWLAFAPSVAAFDNVACSEDGGAHNRWQGHQDATAAGERHGAQAIFEAYSLRQCTSPDLVEVSGSFVFANIVPTDGGFNDIVQVGAGNCRAPNCPGGMQYYTGVGLSSTTPGCAGFQPRAPVATGEGAWSNAAHIYRVQHVANQWQMFVDNSNVRNMAESQICWRPRSAVWFGESWDAGDQIGGDAGNALSITQASDMLTENGNFVATNFNAANACNYAASSGVYHCDVTGTRALNIWTDR